MATEHSLGAGCCHRLQGEVTNEGQLALGFKEWDTHVGHSGLSGEGAYPLLTTRIIIFWVVEALLQDHVGPESRAQVLNSAPGVSGSLLCKMGTMSAALWGTHQWRQFHEDSALYPPLPLHSEDICIPGGDPLRGLRAGQGGPWARAQSPSSAGARPGTYLLGAELSQAQEEQPGIGRLPITATSGSLSIYRAVPARLPYPQAWGRGGGPGLGVVDLRPEGKREGGAPGHTETGARSKIRTGRFLTPRYTAKPQRHADSWQSPFHIPLTLIPP